MTQYCEVESCHSIRRLPDLYPERLGSIRIDEMDHQAIIPWSRMDAPWVELISKRARFLGSDQAARTFATTKGTKMRGTISRTNHE